MTIFKRMMAATAVVIFGFTLYACGAGSSSAVTGTLTQAQFDSLLSTSSAFTSLKAQVAAIGSPAVYIKAPNAPTVAVNRRMTESVGGGSTSTTTAALPSPCNWTLTGRPTSSDPLQSSLASGVSCTGYYFTISEAATSSDNGVIQPFPATLALQFDGAGCTGNMYVGEFSYNGNPGIGTGAITNGAVFRYDPSNTGPTDASTYYMVPANESSQTVTIQSIYAARGCQSVGPLSVSAWAVSANDPTVTGIQNAPVPGPVLISN